ncbi:MAG: 50S ribosomal protein L9 [Propionibacteriaceae bacterium]|jgi:large subunit ribosomal protein L9|nr:50S ribosomal protein L9 [Propionibacteriaceae bacterium]
MKLILTTNISKLGLAGDVVEVKDGYGRNFLVPQGKAINYTRGAEKQIEGIKRARDARGVRDNAHATTLREQIENLKVQVSARAAASGALFGSVTTATLAQAIKKAGGPVVDKRAIAVIKPIKAVGKHTVGVKLTDAVTAHVEVTVTAA